MRAVLIAALASLEAARIAVEAALQEATEPPGTGGESTYGPRTAEADAREVSYPCASECDTEDASSFGNTGRRYCRRHYTFVESDGTVVPAGS